MHGSRRQPCQRRRHGWWTRLAPRWVEERWLKKGKHLHCNTNDGPLSSVPSVNRFTWYLASIFYQVPGCILVTPQHHRVLRARFCPSGCDLCIMHGSQKVLGVAHSGTHSLVNDICGTMCVYATCTTFYPPACHCCRYAPRPNPECRHLVC